MGLIKAAIGAAGGTLADQWKEFFYCEAIGKDVLVTKGVKRVTDVLQIQRVTTILFQTEAVSPLPTVSA